MFVHLMGVDEKATLRQHIGVKVIVGNLVQDCALGARAHTIKALSGKCPAPFGVTDAWLEAYL